MFQIIRTIYSVGKGMSCIFLMTTQCRRTTWLNSKSTSSMLRLEDSQVRWQAKGLFLAFFWLSNAYLPHIMKSGMKENEAGYCRNFLCMDLDGQSLSGGFAVKVNSGASLALHNEKLKQPLGNLDVALQQLGDHLQSLSFLSSS